MNYAVAILSKNSTSPLSLSIYFQTEFLLGISFFTSIISNNIHIDINLNESQLIISIALNEIQPIHFHWIAQSCRDLFSLLLSLNLPFIYGIVFWRNFQHFSSFSISFLRHTHNHWVWRQHSNTANEWVFLCVELTAWFNGWRMNRTKKR